MKSIQRPREPKKQIPIRMDAAEYERAVEISERDGRSVSNFVRQMYLRGLSLYERDNKTTPHN